MPAVRADFVPNPRMAARPSNSGSGSSRPVDARRLRSLRLGDLGGGGSGRIPSDGEPGVELRLSELQPGESATITLIYALCREQAHLMDLQGLDEAAIDQEEA